MKTKSTQDDGCFASPRGRKDHAPTRAGGRKSIKASTGFTLVELSVVLAILALVAVYATPRFVEDLNEKRVSVTAQETQTILDAARTYRMAQGKWPGDGTCSDALSVLSSTNPPMLAGVSQLNKYNYTVTPSCTSSTFSLDQNIVQDWAGVVANALPATIIVNAPTGQIRSTIGIPGTEPALDSKLSRIASGNAELNRMRTDLLLGGNNISEVNGVSAVSAQLSGGLSVEQTATIKGLLAAQGESQFSGKATFGDTVMLNKVVAENTYCQEIGALARNSAGATVSCQANLWKSNGGDVAGIGTGFTTGIPGNYRNRITGGYSCPAGLVPNLIAGIQIGGCNPCLTYSCSKP